MFMQRASDRPGRVGVLLSGRQGERELALRQAEVILGALARARVDATPLFIDGDADLLLRQSELQGAFVALQGKETTNGCVQGFLELLGVPYTGSGVLAASLAGNRKKSKEVWRLHNLPTAAGYLYDGEAGEPLLDCHGTFGFPVLVRPVRAAPGVDTSSPHALGVVAQDELDLEASVEHALVSGDEVLIERLQPGRLFAVAVLDGQPLAPIEIAPPGDAAALSAPLLHGRPAAAGLGRGRLPAERLRSVLRLAVAAYDALECWGAATVLVQVSDRGNELVRDIDVLPVVTRTSLLVRSAAAAGVGLDDLIHRMWAGARLHAHGRRESRRDVQIAFAGPERRRGLVLRAH